MRSAIVTLGVLLFASILLNAALLLRDPEGVAIVPVPRSPVREAALPSPRHAEGDEASRAARLEARVRELEAENAALAGTLTAPAAGIDPLAALRAKVRRLHQLLALPEDEAGSAENVLEQSALLAEFHRIYLRRLREPRAYVDSLKLLCELGLEERKAPLSAEQKARLGRVLDETGSDLEGLARVPALDRLEREIQLEAALKSRITAVLSEGQQALYDDSIAMAGSWNSGAGQWTRRGTAESEILESWTRAYGFEEAQQSAAKNAIRTYLSALDQMKERYPLGYATAYQKLPEAYRYRVEAARAQILALQSIQGTLTRGQLDRLNGQAPREIYLLEDPPQPLGEPGK